MADRKITINQVSKLNAESIRSKKTPEVIRYLDTSSITKNSISNIQVLDSRIEPFPSRAQRKVKDKTIIYSTVRPEQEHFGFIEKKKNTDDLIVSSGFLTLDVIDKDIDPKYLYYLITQKDITNYLQRVASNNVSAYPSINPDDLGSMEFSIPSDLPTQQKIAAVLSALDAKIELNARINAELESMAKTLYDYWFVQFEYPTPPPPSHLRRDTSPKNDRSTVVFGGGREGVVWNDELKRKIPLGWEALSLSEITEVSTKTVNPLNFPEREFKHYSIPAFDETGTYKIESGKEIMSNKFTVAGSDVLVSKLNPWFNRVVYSTSDKDSICSSEFVVWRTENTSLKNYLYMVAKDASFIDYCTRSASGTSHSHRRINPQVMMRYQVAYNKEIANLFGEIINPLIAMVARNRIESQALRELRDWLLPMLMNGQVKVK